MSAARKRLHQLWHEEGEGSFKQFIRAEHRRGNVDAVTWIRNKGYGPEWVKS